MVLETEHTSSTASALTSSLVVDEERLVRYAAAAETATLESCLETMLSWAEQEFGHAELVKAKDEFFWKMGKVFHDDLYFDKRMVYFLDHFLFQRPTVDPKTAAPITPFDAYLSSEQRPIVPRQIAGFRHSIFEIKRIKSSSLVIYDLLEELKIDIKARSGQTFEGINKKDIFQGFVYYCDDQEYLSNGIVFHPPQVRRILVKLIKRVKRDNNFHEQRMLSMLATVNLRYLRHQHVDATKIYDQGLTT